ncbi:MAG: hypothetical protein C5B51_12685 [Terriglobia bacterium]|nr:MAG: hypothetical protein C5B51_12685 [Terriglobia bacterium]
MANPIATIINLNGAWASGGVTGPFISVIGNALSVDMSAYGRPFAAGTVLSSSSITVTFGDDGTHTATLVPGQPEAGTPDTIQWSNHSSWTKVVIPVLTTSLIDLNGKWVSAGTSQPAFTIAASGRSLTIDMSSAGRQTARGFIFDFADIFVDFPDANGFTGKLELPNTIHWSNNSVWQKVVVSKPSVSMLWELNGKIKTLFVNGFNFPPGLVNIVVHSGQFEIAHFSTFAGANGLFTASNEVDCTDGGTLSVVFSQAGQPVVTSGTLCPTIPP